MGLAVEASCTYRGMEVVWASHGRQEVSHGQQAVSHGRQAVSIACQRLSSGQQAVLMVRWYEVGWCYCGHPSQGSSQVALLTNSTVSGP